MEIVIVIRSCLVRGTWIETVGLNTEIVVGSVVPRKGAWIEAWLTYES